MDIRCLPWLFVNPLFKASDAALLKPGDIVITHSSHRHRCNDVHIIVSPVQSAEAKYGVTSRYLLTLDFLCFDFNSSCPTPASCFTGDMGITPYPGGEMSKIRRSFLVPVGLSQQTLAELIARVKDSRASVIRLNDLLRVSGSPFV